MSIVTLNDIRDLLYPGLNHILVEQPTYGELWKEMFKTSPSTMVEEFDVEMRGLGTASIMGENAPLPVDTMGQRFKQTYRHVMVGNSFAVSKLSIDDNLYKSQFYHRAEMLKASLRDAKNQLGANVFNNAFNSAYAYGDGQPACSASHPIDNGTYSNLLVAGGGATIDFGEGALEAMVLLTQKTRDQAGLRVSLTIDKLIIHPDEQFAASRLLDSAFRPDTANNDVNALNKNNYIPNGYRVNQFLTRSGAFFLLTSAENGLRHFQRQAVETDAYACFDTKAVKFSALERYSFGISNPRALIGSPGA